MNPKLLVCLLFLLSFFTLSFAQEPMRTWTNRENRSLESRMLSADATSVTVMTDQAAVHRIELETLSDEDQAYVRSRQGASRSRRGQAADGPRVASWHTDLEKAKEEAALHQLPIFMLFTGSDWCPPCMRLEKNVFEKPEFQEFANNNLVLLMVDFPRRRSLGARQQAANRELAGQHGVRSYPTMIIADAEGNAKDRFGYGGQDVKRIHRDAGKEVVLYPENFSAGKA